jgi:hypothetical protein
VSSRRRPTCGRELELARQFMASEVRSVALELEQMHVLRWWLLRPLLERAVRCLSQATALDPAAHYRPAPASPPRRPQG